MVFLILHLFNCPKFQTFGEFVEFFNQICEVVHIFSYRLSSHSYSRLIIQGIEYVHTCVVVDRYKPLLCDSAFLQGCIANNNVMFDPAGRIPSSQTRSE